ncbi:MAG TPA: hypothetical protein PLZ57_07335 [Pseudobdellovibrionaceae bacterium]|nr:hypothetical protein [Pseudobdellovibrionaceae bacterium]
MYSISLIEDNHVLNLPDQERWQIANRIRSVDGQHTIIAFCSDPSNVEYLQSEFGLEQDSGPKTLYINCEKSRSAIISLLKFASQSISHSIFLATKSDDDVKIKLEDLIKILSQPFSGTFLADISPDLILVSELIQNFRKFNFDLFLDRRKSKRLIWSNNTISRLSHLASSDYFTSVPTQYMLPFRVMSNWIPNGTEKDQVIEEAAFISSFLWRAATFRRSEGDFNLSALYLFRAVELVINCALISKSPIEEWYTGYQANPNQPADELIDEFASYFEIGGTQRDKLHDLRMMRNDLLEIHGLRRISASTLNKLWPNFESWKIPAIDRVLDLQRKFHSSISDRSVAELILACLGRHLCS